VCTPSYDTLSTFRRCVVSKLRASLCNPRSHIGVWEPQTDANWMARVGTGFPSSGYFMLSRDRFGLIIGFTEHLQNVTTNNYDSLTELHTPNISTHKVFTSRCLVAVSNGGRSPSSGFQDCPRPRLPASSNNCNSQLTEPESESESESELLYDCRFTANRFVRAPSPLRLRTRVFFKQPLRP
jgi:hypothetical protein